MSIGPCKLSRMDSCDSCGARAPKSQRRRSEWPRQEEPGDSHGSDADRQAAHLTAVAAIRDSASTLSLRTGSTLTVARGAAPRVARWSLPRKAYAPAVPAETNVKESRSNVKSLPLWSCSEITSPVTLVTLSPPAADEETR